MPVSLSNLIGYAEYRGFSFYFSLDVYASGNSCYAGSSGACGGVFRPSDITELIIKSSFSPLPTIHSSLITWEVPPGTKVQMASL